MTGNKVTIRLNVDKTVAEGVAASRDELFSSNGSSLTRLSQRVWRRAVTSCSKRREYGREHAESSGATE